MPTYYSESSESATTPKHENTIDTIVAVPFNTLLAIQVSPTEWEMSLVPMEPQVSNLALL